jgi:5-methyltetrahydropteroyltriglutamate--homocysteine methyltransferase
MTTHSYRSTVLGYPRIGKQRELKKATESFWRGETNADDLRVAATRLRQETWTTLRDAGISDIPSNTFSFYDHMADTAALFDAIPERHRRGDELSTYFAMARGDDEAHPLEMTKWFDTNYHYLVPEIAPSTSFRLAGSKPVDEYREAKALGIETRPVIVGPVTFLLLSKTSTVIDAEGFSPLDKLDELVEAYVELLQTLAAEGVEWVQLDEPAFVQDRNRSDFEALRRAYERLAAVPNRPKIVVSTYFGPLREALDVLCELPVEGLGIDFSARGGSNLDDVVARGGIGQRRLLAGVVDGRNVWINDLTASRQALDQLRNVCDDIVVSSSCSLLHVPLDLESEPHVDQRVKPWLAFAEQKLSEIALLASGAQAFDSNRQALESRRTSDFVVNVQVRDRLSSLSDDADRRSSPYRERSSFQRKRFDLPPLPTTTIGSFPQTSEIRKARASHAKGQLDAIAYEERMRQEIAHVVELQEQIGIDVLVHGEAERNDMVQYFAEQLAGCITTSTGWVQSYGTRYVRPPIIAGDISRPEPMTVSWSTYAQSLTDKPMKGMLTGPVTMLCWSFVRDDQPWADTAAQMALALRDEVRDLEAADIGMIQVDEPALREGLPLRRDAQQAYLDAGTRAFRLTTSGVNDETQIHTHMCYAEFGEIVDSVAALDADVISLEATRSNMTIADELLAGEYQAEVGPGVYDIHSPRIPSVEEVTEWLRYAVSVLDTRQLWVNPDCGLKTRTEPEVVAALINIVEATRIVREEI